MGNKNITIMLIVLLTIIIIALISIMVISIVDKSCKIKFLAFGNKTKILFQNDYDVEEIKNIKISSESDNVKFIEGTSDKIKVTIYGIDGEEFSVDTIDNKLQIEKTNNSYYVFSFFMFVRQEVLVEIPKDYNGEIRNTIIKWKCRNTRLRKCYFANRKSFWECNMWKLR